MRFVAAGLAAVVVSTIQLGLQHQRSPIGRKRWRALGWWLLLLVIDGAIAGVCVGLASETGSGSAGDFVGWVTIGMLAPLGLRSPVWQRRVIANKEVEPGITVVYDAARVWCAVRLDDHMGEIRRRHREKTVEKVRAQGWDDGTLLACIDEHIAEHTEETDGRVTVIREKAYLAMSDEPALRMAGIVYAIITARYSVLLQRVCSEGPTDACRRRADAAVAKANEFLARKTEATTAAEAASEVASQPLPPAEG